MFYSAYFDRIFHDFVGNSQNSCIDDSLCGRVTFMLCNLCGVLEECSTRIEFEFLEFLVHFVDHFDLLGAHFRMEVIYI
jgi:hypothetical protein